MRQTKKRIAAIENWLLRAITGGAMIFAGFAAWALGSQIVHLVTSRELTVPGFSVGNTTPDFASKAPEILDAYYESAAVTVDGLTGTARAWLVAESAASGLLAIGLCVIVAVLGMRIVYGGPFARSVTWSVGGAAILVMVTGLTQSWFAAVARAEVVDFLGTQVTAGDAGAGPYEGLAAFALNLDLAPIGWGLALALVATAFEIGERMQRDTEGLV